MIVCHPVEDHEPFSRSDDKSVNLDLRLRDVQPTAPEDASPSGPLDPARHRTKAPLPGDPTTLHPSPDPDARSLRAKTSGAPDERDKEPS
jgi:hypothetical protein